MKTERLGNLATFLSGFAFKSNLFNSDGMGTPIIRIRDVIRGRSETYFSGDYNERYLVNEGDYLIGMDGEFNLARWNSEPALLNQRVCKIDSVSRNLDRGYLGRFLPAALKKIEDATPFVTVKHLSVKTLNEIEIPLPPLAEQKRIAAILDAADALRAKRREALAQLDALLQSTFLTLFGDPAENPKKWPLQTVGSLACKFSDGPFGSNLKSAHYTETGVRVIRLQNIGVGEFVSKDTAFISTTHFSGLKKHECLPGDVLIGTLGDPNLRACIQPEWLGVALNKADCVQLRPNPKVATAAFVSALLNQPSTERLAQSLMQGQTRVRISMGRLRNLLVPLPPLPLQQKYAAIVESIERQKTTQRAHLAELDALFASLQHRAFRGEI